MAAASASLASLQDYLAKHIQQYVYSTRCYSCFEWSDCINEARGLLSAQMANVAPAPERRAAAEVTLQALHVVQSQLVMKPARFDEKMLQFMALKIKKDLSSSGSGEDLSAVDDRSRIQKSA